MFLFNSVFQLSYTNNFIYINLYSHKFIKLKKFLLKNIKLIELIEYFRPNYNQA